MSLDVKVSVLIPVCNVEHYLAQCLESIQEQSLTDIEIICIDDGSSDGSGKILDQYAAGDRRIRVIHKENTGYGHSMNVGLSSASGDYIAIVESDDFAEKGMLELLYQTAVIHDADIVKANYFRHSRGADTFADRLRGLPKGRVISVKTHPCLLGLADTIWSGLYRKQFLTENSIRFHETPGASFQDISFALLGWMCAERVCLVQDAVLHYRTDNPGSSMHAPGKVFCVFHEYRRAEEFYEQMPEKHTAAKKYLTAVKFRDYLNHYRRVASCYQYALLVRLADELRRDAADGKLYAACFEKKAWEQLQDILMDRDSFFMNTAKAADDNRLMHCRFQNGRLYFQAYLDAVRQSARVVIYGAGKTGQALAGRLHREGIAVDCFAVTSAADAGRECMGLPVRQIDDIAALAETCSVTIAAAEKLQYEMYTNAERLGFKNIFAADRHLRAEI